MQRSIVRVAWALACVFGAASQGIAQDRSEKQFLYSGQQGDLRLQQGGTARVHARYAVSVVTADYFRGVMDGVPADLDDLGVMPRVALVLEMIEGMPDVNLTLGFASGLSDEEPFDDVQQLDPW